MNNFQGKGRAVPVSGQPTRSYHYHKADRPEHSDCFDSDKNFYKFSQSICRSIFCLLTLTVETVRRACTTGSAEAATNQNVKLNQSLERGLRFYRRLYYRVHTRLIGSVVAIVRSDRATKGAYNWLALAAPFFFRLTHLFSSQVANGFFLRLLKVVSFSGIIFCVTAFNNVSLGQSRDSRGTDSFLQDIRPLQVGDTIPEEVWNLPLQVVNHPDGKDTITLSDYRDKKLIILDFWATWCVPCRKSLPELDSLQKELGDQVLIVPVTKERMERVLSFLHDQALAIPSVVNDKLLNEFFPHRIIPHQVWLSDNVVKSIPKVDQVSGEVIKDYIISNTLSVGEKRDVVDYISTENLSALAVRVGATILKSSVLTGHIEGVPSSIGLRRVGDLLLANFTNVNALMIYKYLLGVQNNQIMVSSFDRARLDYSPLNTANLFCYQVFIPASKTEQEVNRDMLNDLNMWLDIKLDSFQMYREVYIIRKSEAKADSESVSPYNSYKLGNEQPFDSFVRSLNSSQIWTPDQPLFIDTSGYSDKIYTGAYEMLRRDINKLRGFLKLYGLSLDIEKRPVKMYVVSHS